MIGELTNDWSQHVRPEFEQQYFHDLQSFIDQQRHGAEVYPPEQQVFAALALTSLADTKVVILGQDPYHGTGQANGLAFSVQQGVPIPPSLRNIFQELRADISCPAPTHGDLTAWGREGVLLLNTTLTVRAGEAASHQGHGWERFSDRIITLINDKSDHTVFILWGASSRRKKMLIDTSRHSVIESAHPSPLSARHGFFGSRPFSRANTALIEHGREPINWSL
jgi:uracil-DNA glycosylase